MEWLKWVGGSSRPLLGVREALQRWAIFVGAVATGRGGVGIAGFLLVGLLGLGAQRRLARLVVLHLFGEHHVAQAALHGIEFGCGDDVLVLIRQDTRDLFLCQL